VNAGARRFREVPLPQSQDLMPTFPDKEAAAKLGRSRLQPSPDPRMPGTSLVNSSGATLAARAAEVSSLFEVKGPAAGPLPRRPQ
jgi:hypothetical protein